MVSVLTLAVNLEHEDEKGRLEARRSRKKKNIRRVVAPWIKQHLRDRHETVTISEQKQEMPLRKIDRGGQQEFCWLSLENGADPLVFWTGCNLSIGCIRIPVLPNCTVWLKLFDCCGFKLQSNSRAKVVWNMVAKTAEGKSRFSDRIDEYVVGLFRFLHCRCTIQTTRAWWTQCRRMPECTAT